MIGVVSSIQTPSSIFAQQIIHSPTGSKVIVTGLIYHPFSPMVPERNTPLVVVTGI
jgi:hypothetical protein